jgi:hypothetical protein
MRKTLAKLIRCKILDSHDWKAVRIDGEQAWDCRLCGERYSGQTPPRASPTAGP